MIQKEKKNLNRTGSKTRKYAGVAFFFSLIVLLFQLSAVRESTWKCEKSTSAASVKEMSAYNSAGLVDHCGFDYSCAKITAPLTVQSVQAFFCLLCCVPFNRVLCFFDGFL